MWTDWVSRRQGEKSEENSSRAEAASARKRVNFILSEGRKKVR